MLGPTGRDEVERFISQDILPHSEGVQALTDIGIHAYMDPGLRCAGRCYHRFICRLFVAGMLDFTDTDVACEIGLFAVTKKERKQAAFGVGLSYSQLPFRCPAFYEASDCGRPFAAHHAWPDYTVHCKVWFDGSFLPDWAAQVSAALCLSTACALQLSGFSTSEGGGLDQNNALRHACQLYLTFVSALTQ